MLIFHIIYFIVRY